MAQYNCYKKVATRKNKDSHKFEYHGILSYASKLSLAAKAVCLCSKPNTSNKNKMQEGCN